MPLSQSPTGAKWLAIGSSNLLIPRLLICKDEKVQHAFEKFCIFCDKYEHLFPLQFILGFYVTQAGF